MNLFIKLRKRLWLPIKYGFTENGKLKELQVKPIIEIYELMKQEEKELLRAERVGDERAIAKYSERLNLLNWLFYGNT